MNSEIIKKVRNELIDARTSVTCSDSPQTVRAVEHLAIAIDTLLTHVVEPLHTKSPPDPREYLALPLTQPIIDEWAATLRKADDDLAREHESALMFERDWRDVCGERDAARALAAEVRVLRSRLAACEAELERRRQGNTIEGDFVCHDSLRAYNAEKERDAAREVLRAYAVGTYLSHHGSCCRSPAPGVLIVTEESCVCHPWEKAVMRMFGMFDESDRARITSRELAALGEK